ncbi:MAG: FAD-binding oxidoreductase [Opitutales bacterium]
MKLSEYDVTQTYTASVVSSERITDESTAEVRHIVLHVPDANFFYYEGQSIGVLAPGLEIFGNRDHMRLYSIASARSGEADNFAEFSICVRRCDYIDEVSGERFPGVASNYLCDLAPGDQVRITGPYGRQFVAPRDPSANLLMIGVGTGIAPFRAFIKHIYEDRREWHGQVRLFFGARTGLDLLYMNDENGDIANYYDRETFKAFEALSPRPHFDEPPSIDEAIAAHGAEVWDLMLAPKTYVYLSGLTQLERTFDKAMVRLAGSAEEWEAKKAELIADGRWATLFYS